MLKELKQNLTKIFTNERCLFALADCYVYGYDNSKKQAIPDAVVFPLEHDEIVSLVKLCVEHNIPLTARGRATGTAGGAVPVNGGVVVSLERMNKIKNIYPKDGYAIVEPGVLNHSLAKALLPYGLMFAPDPSSAKFCTIGGNVACNAAGPRTLRYGTTSENVLGLKAVTGTANSIEIGRKTSKNVVGYDLLKLIIGSEGTLAIITEIWVKLKPLPQNVHTYALFFYTIGQAVKGISDLSIQYPNLISLEFIDKNGLDLIRKYTEHTVPNDAQSLLIVECENSLDSLDLFGLIEKIEAKQAEEKQKLWQIRKSLSPILRSIATHKINEDIVVPVSKLPKLVQATHFLSEKYNLPIVSFGHAGNGNIHVNIMYNKEKDNENERAHACLADLFTEVLKLEGSISGEHGIGFVKREFVHQQLQPQVLVLMKEIKGIFDPNGILNPGKLL